MAINQDNRVIHRFIRNISDYELGGEFYSQIIPLDTQAYAIYPDKDRNKLFYVIGDGEHTYTEIRDGLGNGESHKEYPVFTESNLHSIYNSIDEEAEARRQADEVLQSNIDQEASERKRFDDLLDETLCEEILIRTSADETLGQNISNETAAREAGDELLQRRISDEEARALQAETVLQSTKQDVLTAGNGISIENNVISSTQSQAVDDIRIDGNSVVSNKIANLGTMAGANTADYSTKDVADTLYADISLEQTVETHTSNNDIHVTTAEKEFWNSKQGELTAGANVQIEDGVISATDTTYTAGTGISIDDGVISNTQTSAEWGNITGTLSEQSDLQNALNEKQDILTAGTGISIDNGVISATGGGSSEWGNITGTLSNQDDLQKALDEKQDVLNTVAVQKVTLADVALTGDYSDLINKPTIPAVNNATLTITQGGETKGIFTANADSDVTIDLDAGGSGGSSSWGSITGNLSDQTDLNDALSGKQSTLTAGEGINITDDTISIDGEQAELVDLPVVNNAVLTIEQNNIQIGTFSANATDNVTINISVPTDVSNLNNDSGYQTYTDVENIVSGKQDELIAGTGIDITDNVISCTQASAEWGNISGTLSNQTDLQDALNEKQNVLNTVVAQKVTLANVALSGNYDDLTNKPTIPVLDNLQTTDNLVTSISASSTDTEYPSAKCVYDIVGDIETLLQSI